MTPAVDGWIGAIADGFGRVQQALFEQVVQPLLFHAGLGNLLEDGYVATGWLLVGVLQLVVLVVCIRPLERWRPVEPVVDRAAVRIDILYTLIHRLGLFRVALFFAVDPLWDWSFGQLTLAGWPTLQLDQALAPLWPGVSDSAWFGFLAYLFVFDGVDYFIHRGQHRWRWWWALHSLHHSQRQMTMWSDNRNHLLDDLLRDAIMVLVARLIGIAPAQFVAVIALTQLLQSLSHANARLDFGPVLGRLIVSPRFHRRHHAIGLGHESRGAGSLGGCNFAVLFPLWDVVFGTARYGAHDEPTGVRDQLPRRVGPNGVERPGRDYGRGFWAQQWLGLCRLVGRG